MTVIFAISFIIEYWLVYQEKEVENYTTKLTALAASKNEETQQSSWILRVLWYWRPGEHPCAPYNRADKAIIFFQVNPLIVLSRLISRFLLCPLEHAGSSLGQFMHQSITQLLWIHQYTIPFLIPILLFVSFFDLNLNINMPYGLGSISIRR